MQQPATGNKIHYIDNLRVLLTILVVLHHTVICYGGPGDWYFTDPTTNKTAVILMTLFVATNQAFFMGFFFFLSAFFTEPSYLKKGAEKFMADRLKRLGIPLLFYSFILGPCMNFLIYRFAFEKKATFLQYLGGYDNWIDPGVLWFVAALLIFTFIYVLIKLFAKHKTYTSIPLPSNNVFFLFALALGLISYVVRIYFPIGWVLDPVGFQFAHFPQYIALFITGIIASRNGWMNLVDFKTGKRWLVIALVLVFVVFPGIFLLIHSPLEMFRGEGTWQSLTAAVWEQLTGIAIMVSITGIARQKWNYSTPLLQQMSRAAFATYIFHPLVVISISLLLYTWRVDPVVKLLVAAPAAVIVSFILGWGITKLPLAKDIV